MNNWSMVPTLKLIGAWEYRLLARTGKLNQPVSKMRIYYFIKRAPPDLKLGPIKQRKKEPKRIWANDVGPLVWSAKKNLFEDVPARLVYNFDACGFRPREGQKRECCW